MKTSLADLNIMDAFLFGKLMTHPVYGVEFGKILIKTILGKEVPYLRVTAQALFYGADTNYHGIRLDAYLDEAAEGEETQPDQEIFDIEPDRNNRKEEVKALPRRIRFYHTMIDQRALESGEGYENLRNVWVIMILSYDPVGEDRIVYTIRNHIVELPHIPYDDGARTMLLYTHGTKGPVSEELRQLLSYVEDTTREKAVNVNLHRVQEMVESIKLDKEANKEYMKSWEWERKIKKEATEEGFNEGWQQGIEQGMQQGIEQGIQQGIQQERINTERESRRAEEALREVSVLRARIAELEKTLG